VSKRVSPAQRLRVEVDEVFTGHCQVILVGLVIRVYRSRVVRRF
jgi:hypothetical protein